MLVFDIEISTAIEGSFRAQGLMAVTVASAFIILSFSPSPVLGVVEQSAK